VKGRRIIKIMENPRKIRNIQISIYGFLVFLAILSCQQQKITELDSHIRPIEMLIDISDMPNNWNWTPNGFPSSWEEIDTDYYSDDGASVIFGIEVNGKVFRASHMIVWFNDEKTAKRKFELQIAPVSNIEIDGWTYRSTIAEDQVFNCDLYDIYNCQWNIRYGKYVSEFFSWIGPDLITIHDMERIAKAIDEIMREKLLIP
jgi:hypothetical protein